MLTYRLLVIKMKRCYFIYLIVLSLLSIFYFFRNIKNESAHPSDDKILAMLPNYNVHIFYDARFRNIKVDGIYRGWNYQDVEVEERITSAFYPSLGLYSSNDATVIDIHMKQIKDAGVGVVVVMWWPKQFQSSPPMDLLLKYALKHNLKITIQVQNYKERNIENLKSNLHYFFKMYRQHPALYKIKTSNSETPLPLIYIYDSYMIPIRQWNILLSYTSNETIRGTDLDAVYIGTLVEELQQWLILNSDFDGFYTYFAINNFTYGSTWYNWPYIQDFAKERDVIFIPTVGPGYNDRSKLPDPGKVRPYANRNCGAYYTRAWMRAVVSRARFVSINSFNGWKHGTQIEPAQPKTVLLRNETFSYANYEPESPDIYLSITRNWVIDFTNRSTYRVY